MFSYITKETVPRFPTRKWDSHKGDFGRVLLVGGSVGMSGAIAASGRAAILTGSGLVKIAVPTSILPIVASFALEIMTSPLPENRSGKIAATAYEKILSLSEQADVVVLGPGLGRSAGLDALVFRLNREIRKPMLLDADALNAIASHGLERATDAFAAILSSGISRILTPHPGEFSRLNQNNFAPRETRQRVEAAENFLQRIQNSAKNRRQLSSSASGELTLVLKGAETVVTDGRQTFVNTSGNPGMATAGSGDVLAGIIASLIGQNFSLIDAAKLGAFLHGRTADIAYRQSQIPYESIIASTLINHIPDAINELIRESEK
ncbi:MAG: NAD(P)H-hydrate dehydratase [Planctomycetaceae bacterium]|jgi:NAD(P)H-hydrate epimerase|nr:NAD(P)H-hydrate dehydratase [Planctomycetaceae bacterium]